LVGAAVATRVRVAFGVGEAVCGGAGVVVAGVGDTVGDAVVATGAGVVTARVVP